MKEPNGHSPDLDAEALIDQELDRYGGLIPPERRAIYREMVLAVVREHSIVQPMVDRVRPRAVPATSEERERGSADEQRVETRSINALRSAGGRQR